MKKSNTWIVWVLLSSCFLVHAETAYVQVVDEAGSSIPSAQFSAYWFERAFLAGKLVSKSGSFTCNTEGIATIPLGGKMMVVPNVAGKEGYVFERYLNMNMDFLSGTTDTKGNPRRMILRKPEPASIRRNAPACCCREGWM